MQRRSLFALPGALSFLLLSSLAGAQDVDVPANLTMLDTTDSTVGSVLKGGAPFLHNFGTGNTFLGSNAGNLTMDGANNTVTGFQALQSNTTGFSNTASGYLTLYSNTTGNYNTASGRSALFSNTTGSENTANGRNALLSNTTGGFNTASGSSALFSNTTGGFNTASGNNALVSNTTGSENTASGSSALAFNTIGSGNTANGRNALLNNTTGNENTASGYGVLQSNTTGGGNTASGYWALHNNNMGVSNTASGYLALFYNTTGSENTAIGNEALFYNTTGSENTAIGFRADASNLFNATAIGARAVVNASNKIRLGNAAVTVIEGQVPFTYPSDRNLKESFQPVDGEVVLSKIGGLSLTSWNYIGQDAKQFRHYGPMAQDFFAAFGHDAIGTIGTDTTITSGDLDGILMVAAQALEKRTVEQTKKIDTLTAENIELKARLEALERMFAGYAQTKAEQPQAKSAPWDLGRLFFLDRDSHQPQQAQGIGGVQDSIAQPVVEGHFAVDELILEVEVLHPAAQLLLQRRQRQVVGAHRPGSTSLEQQAQHLAGSDLPLARVRPPEDFVEQEQGAAVRRRRRVEHRLDPLNLGVKMRDPQLERIAHPHAGEHPKLGDLQGLGADGSAGQRQNRICPHRAQQRAFPRHVRAGDDQRMPGTGDIDVVANRVVEERVAEPSGDEYWADGRQIGKGELRAVVRQGGQAGEGFELRERIEPPSHPTAELDSPGLQPEKPVDVPEEEHVEHRMELGGHLREAEEPSEAAQVQRDPFSTQVGRELLQQRIGEALRRDCLEDALEAGESHLSDHEAPVEFVELASNETEDAHREEDSRQPGVPCNEAELAGDQCRKRRPRDQPSQQSGPADRLEIRTSLGPGDERAGIRLLQGHQPALEQECLPEVDRPRQLADRAVALPHDIGRSGRAEPLGEDRFAQPGGRLVDQLEQRALAEDVQIAGVEVIRLGERIPTVLEPMPLSGEAGNPALVQFRQKLRTPFALEYPLVRHRQRRVDRYAGAGRIPSAARKLAKKSECGERCRGDESQAAKVGQARGALLELLDLSEGVEQTL